jgi:hypothetical protein
MSTWQHESSNLFRTARARFSPSDSERERVRARLAKKLGVAVVGGAIVTTTSSTAAGAATAAAKGGTFALVAKIAAPIVVASAVAGVAVPRVLRATHDAPVPVTTSAPKAAPAATRIPAPTMNVVDLPTATPVAPTPSARRATPSSPDDEARIVGEIDAALRAGDAATASRLVDEHARRYPRGALVPEREGARVIARCLSGARASSGAGAYIAAHPRSPMRGRIEAACGADE